VQYFQWRKSRGSAEKLHGAVVGHDGSSNTRVFREVSQLGRTLGRLADVTGAHVNAEVALVFDWESGWAIEESQGPRNDGRRAYEQTVMAHHYPFWTRGTATDVIDSECDFSPFRVIVAPMLYMIKPGTAERLADFVAGGRTFVNTYWSGIVDQHDLCFLGGFPGPLRPLLGIWSEERMLGDFYRSLASRVGLRTAMPGTFPEGVSAQIRTKGEREFLFLLNFTPDVTRIFLRHGAYTDLVSDLQVEEEISLQPYGSAVLVDRQTGTRFSAEAVGSPEHKSGLDARTRSSPIVRVDYRRVTLIAAEPASAETTKPSSDSLAVPPTTSDAPGILRKQTLQETERSLTVTATVRPSR
jgi:beta-galactosidase GanA